MVGGRTVSVSGVWAGVDSAWEQKKLKVWKMLVNRADSHTSTAPMKMASHHFTREDKYLGPENAFLGVFLCQTEARCGVNSKDNSYSQEGGGY